MAATNVLERLQVAKKEINRPYITAPMVVRMFTLNGGGEKAARKVYQAMEKEWKKYLESNNLINPGTRGVPNEIARKYLRMYGITEDGIDKALNAEK